MIEAATAYGYVRLIKTDEHGEVTEHLFKNQLTNYAKSQAANMWVGPTATNYVVPTIPSQIKVGTGSPTPPLTGTDPTDTALWTAMGGTGTQPLDFSTVWLTYTSQYSVSFLPGEATGTWTEAGLFDSASPTNNMFAHVMLSNYVKASGDTVTVQWNVLHIGN